MGGLANLVINGWLVLTLSESFLLGPELLGWEVGFCLVIFNSFDWTSPDPVCFVIMGCWMVSICKEEGLSDVTVSVTSEDLSKYLEDLVFFWFERSISGFWACWKNLRLSLNLFFLLGVLIWSSEVFFLILIFSSISISIFFFLLSSSSYSW